VQEAVRCFSSEPSIGFGGSMSAIDNREELGAVVLQARSSVTTLKVNVRDKMLRIEPDRQSAVMKLTAEGVATYEGRTERDIREFELTWIKQDKRWVIDRARTASSIHRPPDL
jgi:hypothetical protein